MLTRRLKAHKCERFANINKVQLLTKHRLSIGSVLTKHYLLQKHCKCDISKYLPTPNKISTRRHSTPPKRYEETYNLILTIVMAFVFGLLHTDILYEEYRADTL